MDLKLTPMEIRVLGCLIEKELGTPEYYPLSLKALVAACNQKNNRDPVLTLEEAAVEQVLADLRYQKELVGQVTVTGSRVSKYRHNLLAKFSLSPEQLAVLCELFLRGPQTVGELRGRASRLRPFAGIADVDAVLSSLVQIDGGPLVVQLPRESGRRDSRWAHLFGGPPATIAVPAPPAAVPAEASRLASIEQALAALRRDVDEIRSKLGLAAPPAADNPAQNPQAPSSAPEA